MTPQLWQKVCRTLDEVLPLPAAQRQEKLQLLRQSDPAVAAEVDELLRHDTDRSLDLESAVSSFWRERNDPDPRPTPPAVPEQRPVQVGPYKVEEELGKGGMGVVYRVRDRLFHRSLAVKVLAAVHQDNADLKRRFLEEAHLMGQLQHPGIPPVHDLGELPEGQPYFAMKLIQGQTLAQLLKERPSGTGKRATGSDTRFLGIFEQVCRTLAYAHACGVLHRDLKPSNIMVGAFGEVQVMDWGLAKIVSPTSSHTPPPQEAMAAPSTIYTVRLSEPDFGTAAGVAMGTPAYMAPEQARGEIDNLDQRCDVFGLGAILCEILTGKPPFAAGNTPDNHRLAMKGDLSGALARLQDAGADAELVRLAQHCLAPARVDRPADAGVVADAVAQYQAAVQQRLRAAEVARGQAEVRAAEETKRRLVERQKRRTTTALLAAVVLLVLGGSGVALWYQREQADRIRREEQRQQTIAGTLAQAQKLRGALHAQLSSPGGVFALLNKPVEWQHTIASAAAALRQARNLESSADGPLAPALRQDMETLTDLLERDEADRQLALALEKVRLDKVTLAKGQVDNVATVKAYGRVFRQAGFAVSQGDVAALAAQIKQSPIREQLLAALDDWALTAAVTKDVDRTVRLLALARQSDPDPVRGQLRDVKVWLDRAALLRMATNFKHGSREQVRRLSPQLYLLMGLLLSELGADGEAWLRAGQAAYPTDFYLNLVLGNRLRAKNQAAEAVGFARVVVAVRPHLSAAHMELGNALRATNDVDGAIEEYRRAIALDPTLAWNYNNLGIVLRAKQDLAGARAAYHRAIALDPKLAQAHYNLGIIRHDQRDVAGAIQAYRQAIQLDPRYVLAHTNLGVALQAKGDLAGAVQAYRQASQLDPKNALGHYNLGNALFVKKDRPGAMQEFRRAIQLDPKHVAAHHKLGNVLCDLHDLDGAIQEFRRAIALNPGLARAHANLGDALRQLGDLEGAIQANRRAIALNPNYALAHLNLGIVLAAQEDQAGAIAAYRRAIQADPRYVPAHGALGAALLAQGEFTRAQAEAQQCLQLCPEGHPQRALAQNLLGQCQQALLKEQRVKALLEEHAQPFGSVEQLILAKFCRQYKRYPAAVRFYATALTVQPALAEDLARGHRYHAACAAALAAAGQSKGLLSDKLVAADKAKLRRQALDWLRADLKLLAKSVADAQAVAAGDSQKPISPLAKFTEAAPKHDPAPFLRVCDHLQRWQSDPDLMSVRGDGDLTQLPQEEQQDWRKLWTDVRALDQQVRAAFQETHHAEKLTSTQREQVHEAPLTAGKTYILDLQSKAFDAYLRLEDSQGRKLDENNDREPGASKDSRIVFTPAQDGVYRLIATASPRGGTGAYTLLVREFLDRKR